MFLSALAGFVDGTGFVLTRGLFVSFMSGNSTRFSVGIAERSGVAFLAGGLIVLFLAGVVAGALLSAWKPVRRKTIVLTSSTFGLALSAALVSLSLPTAGALVLAAAMGSLNNVFLRDGEVSIGVTYMTGTLVRAGQRIAGAVRGEGPSDWLPYLLLWGSLASGATAGGLVATWEVTTAIWAAVAAAASISVFTHRLEAAAHQ